MYSFLPSSTEEDELLAAQLQQEPEAIAGQSSIRTPAPPVTAPLTHVDEVCHENRAYYGNRRSGIENQTC